VVFDGAGGAGVAGIGRGGSEPVGSAAFGDSDCDGDCGVGAADGVGVTVGAALGATSGVALDGDAAAGGGAPSGVGPGVAAGDGSALPKGCGDPLCGGAAFGFLCGGAVGSAGLCHGADASPAGRLSWKICNAICKQLTVKSAMAPATKSLRAAHGLLSCISPFVRFCERRRRDLERVSSSLAGTAAA
jgi:hypothetical protein